MSVSNILIQTGANAGKIKPELIVGGGAGVVDSVNATAGIFIDNQDVANPIVQIGTLIAGDLIVGTATPHIGAVLQQGANGTYLGVSNAGVLGYSVPPTQGIPFTAGGQMLYSGANAPFPDTLLNLGNAGQVLGVAGGIPTWTDTGGSGLISANLPLIEEADPAPNSKISINFTASVGEIPYGTGVAKVGALTVAPNPASSNQFLGTVAGVPTWKNVGGSSISGIAPIVEIVGAGDDSQIAIAFQNAGQIPYGTAVNTGTLTNAPVAGQILGMAGNPAVPTWIDAGGSGTITGTFPIVETAGGTNESIISIGFANKGDMAVGAGGATAGAGVILPPATADDYVLSSFSSAPSGMRWVAPTITQNIIRSATATTIVPDPQTTQDTLILVAEDPNGSWDLQPNPTNNTQSPILPYATEAESFGTVVVGAIAVSCVAVPEIVNSIRCIHIWIITNVQNIPIGILYQGAYASPALVSGIVNPPSTPTVAYINNCFIVSGSFEFFHYDGDSGLPDVACSGIALIDCSQIASTVVVVKPLIDVGGQIGNSITGVSLSQGGPINRDPVVNKIINYGNYLWIFGNFDGFINGAVSITGWWSIAKWNLTTGEYDEAGTTVGFEGLAVSFDANVAPGAIEDAYLGYANNLYIVGAWSYVASVGTPIAWNPVAVGMTGFAVWVQGQNPNPWVSTPSIGGGFDGGTCIRPSLTQVGYLMMTGSNPIDPLFYELNLNVMTFSTGAIPPSPYQGWMNCIASSANIDIGFGVNTYDFVQYQDKISGDMFVIWFSLTAPPSNPPLATALLPSPTGLKPYYVPNVFPPSYNGPYTGFTNYGMVIYGGATPNINVMATGGIYRFDPAIHANLDFTGNFYYNGVAKTTARFSTATQGNESQSFVASTSLKAWIQTGAKTTSLTYLP